MVSRVIPVDSFDLVIFGGTGDLARRKILPGLFRRFASGQMPDEGRIIGAARSDMTCEEFRTMVKEAVEEFDPKSAKDKENLSKFLDRVFYVAVDAKGDGGWKELGELLRPDMIRAFYFSVAPSLFGAIAERLKTFDLADDDSRIVVEKPFGKDLETARTLNRASSFSRL